jgi:hypothetical protein
MPASYGPPSPLRPARLTSRGIRGAWGGLLTTGGEQSSHDHEVQADFGGSLVPFPGAGGSPVPLAPCGPAVPVVHLRGLVTGLLPSRLEDPFTGASRAGGNGACFRAAAPPPGGVISQASLLTSSTAPAALPLVAFPPAARSPAAHRYR